MTFLKWNSKNFKAQRNYANKL